MYTSMRREKRIDENTKHPAQAINSFNLYVNMNDIRHTHRKNQAEKENIVKTNVIV